MAKSRRAPEEARRRPDDDEDDAPRRRRRAADDEDEDDDEGDDGPIKPRRKKKSAAGPVKIVLRVVGAVLGAILVIIFLVWVYSPVGTDYQMLCYFPKETTSLQGYDLDEVSKNAKMTEVHQLLLNNYKTFGDRRWGSAPVKETDVLRYLHGHVSGNPEEEKDLPPQQKRGDITVIRFKKDVDEAAFVASFNGQYLCEEQQSKDGKKFYQLWWKRRVPPDNHEEREDDVSFFFPNAKTLVYATTRRELTECMTRTPGKVVLDGNIRELADKVDGHYFNAAATGGGGNINGVSHSIAFSLGFMDEEFKDARKFTGVVGTGSWFASNGNDFLFASANLYGDAKTAREVRRKIAASLNKAQEDIWQSESGKPSGLTDPFNAPQPKGGPGGPPGGGLAMAPVGPSSEQTKDIIDALAEYTRSARVYTRGKLVIVEGLFPHGTPEQGVFEKFWHAIQQKFTSQGAGMGAMMGGGGGLGPPMGGPGPPGMAPGNVPIGPGR